MATLIVPARYNPLHKRLVQLAGVYGIRSVLELGCGDWGRYVKYLRTEGFDAEGIDGGDYARDAPYLHHVDSSEMAEIFGERKFDAIVSLRVFSEGAQMAYRFKDMDQRIDTILLQARYPEFKEQLDNELENVCRGVLTHCFVQLREGGLMLMREGRGERIHFQDELPPQVGFRVLRYNGLEAVLQKP